MKASEIKFHKEMEELAIFIGNQAWHSQLYKEFIVVDIEAEDIYGKIHIYLEHRMTEETKKISLARFGLAKGLLKNWTGLTART